MFGKDKIIDPYNTMGTSGTGRSTPRSARRVTPGQFRRMSRRQQQEFLNDPGTSDSIASAAGVASRCGSCGEPFMTGQSTSGHRCDPAHYAQSLRKLREHRP